MVRASISTDEQYNVYETYALLDHTVTAGEESAGTVEIAGVEAHTIVLTDEEYALGYLDDERATITGVTFPVADTIVAITGLVEGQILDLYFPIDGTGCGSLISNTNTGKLNLPRLQRMQNWEYNANIVEVAECGSDRLEPVSLGTDGMTVLGLNRLGNTAMADFVLAKENQTPLLIDVVDTTVSPATHDILLGARVEDYDSVSAAEISERGLVTDTIIFSIEDVDMI